MHTIIALLLTVLSITIGKTGETTTIATMNCRGAWQIVPTPNVKMHSNFLDGVAVIAANDAWAVGNASGNMDNMTMTLTEHWNGSTWSVIPSPNPSPYFNYLIAVAAVARNNVWAVGFENANGPDRTLIEHWDGTRWSIVSSPNVGPYANQLTTVTAVSVNDIWVTGNYDTSNHYMHPLVLHWDGQQWQRISVLTHAGALDNVVGPIKVLSSSNIWTSGDYATGDNNFNMVEHWNGTGWNIVPAPNPSKYINKLADLAPVSANDIWAVGDEYKDNFSPPHTLIEHWNGMSWSIVPAPPTEINNDSLNAVAALSPNNIWATGMYGTAKGTTHMLIEHWDGTKWSVVPGPTAGPMTVLTSIARVPGSNSLWATGYVDYGTGVYQTLSIHYC